MSKRRNVGDIVLLDDEEGGRPYLVRIARSAGDFMTDDCALCDDPECQEWRLTDVLDKDCTPTGEHVYHVKECCMDDADAADQWALVGGAGTR